MALTDTKIKNLKPADKPYRLADAEGLYIEVSPTGSKLWRFKYRYGGKQKVLAIGKYPVISLADARDKRLDAKRLLADGIDPGQAKKEAKRAQTNTFKALADEWWYNQQEGWSDHHKNTTYRRLEMNIFPWIGDRPVREISSRELLEVYRRIENRGALEVAKRTARICSQIFAYGVAAGIVENNPGAEMSKALKVRPKRNWPALTDPKKLKKLLEAIDTFDGTFPVLCALKFSMLTFARPGEIRKAEWPEIDFENDLWIIPAEKMKAKREQLVPLSRQAVSILKELQPLTGSGQYVFPANRGKSRPMSENTVLAALRRLGYSRDEMVAHSFRSIASTLLHEQGWPSRVIELQLAHVDQNKIRGIYNRAEHIDDRTRMMQAWADYLDGLKSGAKVLTINGNKAIN